MNMNFQSGNLAGGTIRRVPDSAHPAMRGSTGGKENRDRTRKIISRAGQSLIEVVIAMGLASILLPAILTGLVASREGKAQEAQRLEATALVKEAEEITRNVREKGWSNISNGTYHPGPPTGSVWTLNSGQETTPNGLTRKIEISDALRNSSGNIIQSGGTADPSTKKIVTTVSWQTPIVSEVNSTVYLSRFLNNESWLQTRVPDFNAGSHNGTRTVNLGGPEGGAVELDTTTSTSQYGNQFRVELTSSIGNMTSANHKTSLRFTAQTNGVVNAIRVYLHAENNNSPVYRYGIQMNNPSSTPPNTPSGAWVGNYGTLTANSTGWKTITLGSPATLTQGQIYHIVVEPNGSPNPTGSNNIGLRRSSPNNLRYPLTNLDDPNTNTLFKTSSAGAWTVQNFQPIYELDFGNPATSYEGNPYESGTATTIYNTTAVGEKFTISGPDKIAQSVSFYLKRIGAPQGNLIVELRNSTNGVIYSGTMATTSAPTVFTYVTHTFSSLQTLSAGTYSIILRSPGSLIANNGYQIYNIATTNAANYNSITYDGTNSVYTFTPFFPGLWTDANNQDIGGFYFTIQTPGASNGDFTSQTFDAGSAVGFNNITWTANVPPTATLRLQAATNNDNSTWNYFGPNGTGDYYTSPGQIPLGFINGRYVKFKATLTGNGSTTPTLNDVSINYSP